MAVEKNERRINSLLQQMNRQTGYADLLDKIDTQSEYKDIIDENKEMASITKDLKLIDQQDVLRLRPIPNENSREELVKEEDRHRIRGRVHHRVRQRVRIR